MYYCEKGTVHVLYFGCISLAITSGLRVMPNYCANILT